MKFKRFTMILGVALALLLGGVQAQEGAQDPPAPPKPAGAQTPPKKPRPQVRVSPNYVRQTHKLFEQGNYDAARPRYQTIVSKAEWENDPKVLFRLGKCQLQGPNPNVEDARKNFLRVLEIEPDYAEAFFGLARVEVRPPNPDVAKAKAYLTEAIKGGVNVLGLIDQTTEFQQHKEISSVQFTKELIEAAKEWVFNAENRQDPFRIPRRVEEQGEDSEKIMTLEEQENFIEKLEADWARAKELIFMDDEEQKNQGLDLYGDLKKRIKDYEEQITFLELRIRMERVEEAMKEEWGNIKWVMLERLAKEGQTILTNMDNHYRKKEYEAVMKMYDEELVKLAEKMIAIDEDFTQVAEDLLAKGQVLYEDAKVGLEIQQLKIKVKGIAIGEVEHPGAFERTAIILNESEAYEGDQPEAPKDWKPKQRKYIEGKNIYQIEDLVIKTIHRNKVECVYKEKYTIDLDLEKREAEE